MNRRSAGFILIVMVLATGCGNIRLGPPSPTPTATGATAAQVITQPTASQASATSQVQRTATATVQAATATQTKAPQASATATKAATATKVATATQAATATKAATATQTSAQAPTAVSSSGANDGTKLDPLIEASKTCKPSKVSYTTAVDFFGILTSSTSDLEIRGPDAGKCGFHTIVTGADAVFTEAAIKTMKDGGATDEQIKSQQAEMRKQAQSTIGTEKTCKFKNEDLTAMLTRWKNGAYSSGDWDNADCS